MTDNYKEGIVVLGGEKKEQFWNTKSIFFVTITIGILFAVLIFKFFFTEVKKEKTAFQLKDSTFRILILPFKVHGCQERDDVGGIIKNRLNDFNQQEGLNLHLYYLNYNITENFTEDSAKYLQKYHNADLIIYGNYRKGDCTNDFLIRCYINIGFYGKAIDLCEKTIRMAHTQARS